MWYPIKVITANLPFLLYLWKRNTHPMKKSISLLSFFLCTAALAAPVSVTSPDGRLAVTVSDEARYSVTLDGKEILRPSYLGFNSNRGDFTVTEVTDSQTSKFEGAYKLDRIKKLRELYALLLEKKQCITIKDLAVKGRDLMEAGISPGPGMGSILEKMLEDVLDEPEHNDKEYLLEHFVNEKKA